MRRFFPLLACFLALSARADELPASVMHALKVAGIPASATAAWVREVDATSPRLALNARTAMNPASTMKLVTTYAALDLLGPAYVWKTEAFAAGGISERLFTQRLGPIARIRGWVFGIGAIDGPPDAAHEAEAIAPDALRPHPDAAAGGEEIPLL